MDPIQLKFKDDGKIPNSKFPVLIYKNVFSEEKASAEFIIAHFEEKGWSNSWVNGIFDYHHFHSNTHEALGISQGYATLMLGGEQGEQVSVEEGDVIVLPAGVGHKKLSGSDDFEVVGAYPNGADYDILTGDENEKAAAIQNISQVPMPDNDPVYGKMEGLLAIWKPLE